MDKEDAVWTAGWLVFNAAVESVPVSSFWLLPQAESLDQGPGGDGTEGKLQCG